MDWLKWTVVVVAGTLATAAPAAEKISVSGSVLSYDTENVGEGEELDIISEDVDVILGLLTANPAITTVHLNSSGGGYYAAIDIAEMVVDFELDTVVQGKCSSSCALIFLGGSKRTMTRGSRLGFHQNSWSESAVEDYYERRKDANSWTSPFEFASWLYEDTQEEVYREMVYLLGRGVDPEFALETIRNRGSAIWFPRRSDLLAAGVLTE